MASWPVSSIGLPEYGLTQTLIAPQIKHSFEANYTAVRRQFSRDRYKFDQSWKLMTNSQHARLVITVKSFTGNMFDWTHPVTTAVHTCVLSENGLESTIVSPGFWAAKISLEEV